MHIYGFKCRWIQEADTGSEEKDPLLNLVVQRVKLEVLEKLICKQSAYLSLPFIFLFTFFFFLVLSFPWTKMMTNKLDNFNEYEGQKPKLTHFTTFPELHWFVKHSYLKDINSQRNIFYFLLSLIFLFFDRIPLYWCKARQTAF